MITTLTAAAAEPALQTTWPDVAMCAIVVAGVCVFFWLRWR